MMVRQLGVAAAALTLALCAVATVHAAGAAPEGAADAAAGAEQRRALEAAAVEPVQTPRVEVTATRGTAADSPDALATDVINHEDAVAVPSDFQDLIARVPGVGATGQSGIFEAFSIRGSNANQIQILFAGMPLTAQRRAGVPVSFVEPVLLGDIAVTRGPAVVHYGPGALGGAVSVEPRWFDAPLVTGNYATGGGESMFATGTGNESFSIGAARHRSSDSEAPDGTPLHTQFDRVSGVVQYRTQFGEFAFDAMLAPSRTEDAGKSNSRFPQRDTIYPYDEHTVGRARLRHDSGFEASVQGHHQRLRTMNRRPDPPTTYADVESRDVGVTVQQTITAGAWSHDIGVEYLGRRGVDAFDASGSIDNRHYTLRDGREHGWSLFAISDWDLSPGVAMEFGARHSMIDQKQGLAEPDDSDVGFTAGAVWQPSAAQRWSLNLAKGYRFPSLEERFFTGVTAQDEVVGNPGLGSERSYGVDLGHARTSGHWRAEAHLWRTDVEDLIQLTAVAPGVNGFENIGSAKLWGAEARVDWRPLDGLALRASAAIVNSEDERTGEPLFGSPPPTAELEAKYDVSDAWTFGSRYMRRWEMDDPGFEEVERDEVDIIDAELTWRFSSSWSFKLYAQNLFNENYFATADALSALSPERSVGLIVAWTPE